jgi:hypothetical protein
VIAALDGIEAVAGITHNLPGAHAGADADSDSDLDSPAAKKQRRRAYKATANWKSFGQFPARTFVVMTQALQRRGKHAPAALWGMVEPARGEAA